MTTGEMATLETIKELKAENERLRRWIMTEPTLREAAVELLAEWDNPTPGCHLDKLRIGFQLLRVALTREAAKVEKEEVAE